MNNVIMRKVEMRGDYRPLSDREMIGTFDLSTPPFNPGIVFFRGDDGSDGRMPHGRPLQSRRAPCQGTGRRRRHRRRRYLVSKPGR